MNSLLSLRSVTVALALLALLITFISDDILTDRLYMAYYQGIQGMRAADELVQYQEAVIEALQDDAAQWQYRYEQCATYGPGSINK